MKLSNKAYHRLEPFLPLQRGNVVVPNKTFLEAILFVIRTGIQWRELDESTYGKWNTVYKRANRWSKNGVLDRVFHEMQKENMMQVGIVSLDSTSIKVHQDAM